MHLAAKITTTLAGLSLAVASLAACAASAEVSGFSPQPDSTPTSTPTDADNAAEVPLTELPEWARESVPWLVYPEGFTCTGTEGCPNDYRVWFGEPADVLPEGVEYYDPAVHTWVFPADQ
jgi:hypothetical protein